MKDAFKITSPDPAILSSERERVLSLLQKEIPAARVLEVGSTAVPGVIGKGDVDILVKVEKEGFVPARATLDGMFPRSQNQLSNEAFQGYAVPSPLDMAIQLTIAGGPYDVFEPFLDALRRDPALVEAYNALKREWDGKFMDGYRKAKQDFIEEVLGRTE